VGTAAGRVSSAADDRRWGPPEMRTSAGSCRGEAPEIERRPAAPWPGASNRGGGTPGARRVAPNRGGGASGDRRITLQRHGQELDLHGCMLEHQSAAQAHRAQARRANPPLQGPSLLPSTAPDLPSAPAPAEEPREEERVSPLQGPSSRACPLPCAGGGAEGGGARAALHCAAGVKREEKKGGRV
jgi:hypothetical protein